MRLLSMIPYKFLDFISFCKKVNNKVKYFYLVYIKKDIFHREIKKWFQDEGDSTLRLDYPDLNASSIVFDLGGFKGDFAQKIHEKYGCKVYLFEPHPKFYQYCVERFKDNENIIPFHFGLSNEKGIFKLTDSSDASSFLGEKKENKNYIECQVKDFFEVVDELQILHIDLMKINIEGGEYPLLEHIIQKGKLNLVNNYQIQFHNFIDNANERREAIVNQLKQRHKRTWCYEFVWENWEISLLK